MYKLLMQMLLECCCKMNKKFTVGSLSYNLDLIRCSISEMDNKNLPLIVQLIEIKRVCGHSLYSPLHVLLYTCGRIMLWVCLCRLFVDTMVCAQ